MKKSSHVTAVKFLNAGGSKAGAARRFDLGRRTVYRYLAAAQKGALAEKAEAVAMWKKIGTLARQIKFADATTQDFVETSCAYGRIKYSIFEQGWTILLCGAAGDQTKNYDCQKISAAIARYDELWQEWRTLKAAHPSCATIYKDVVFGNRPGLGAAVERYRKICASLRSLKPSQDAGLPQTKVR